MNTGARYTFWKFIQENKIVIPVIQRDYAQGRTGKEELRKRFLTNLKEAVENKSSSHPLILDFVYGMMRGNDRIVPLDGQQRLTTLWLLHWYAFLMSNNNVTKNNLPIFNNFTYETRSSSRYFIENLCDEANFKKLRELCRKKGDDSKPIREAILDQTWFMKEWEQDPTVKAMLNMLGGNLCSIESEFRSSKWEDVWKKLYDQEICPIRFYYLPIDGEIQQEPDDIYIKMNARGEHLTDFENFKADLIKYVRDKKNDWKSAFDNNENPELELSRLIDTNWTDVFWKNLSDEQKEISKDDSKDKPLPNIDKQFFAFLNRNFVNSILIQNLSADELTEKKDANKDDLPKVKLFQYLYGKSGSADTSICYKDFDIYKKAGVITSDNFQAIKNIMTVLSDKSYKDVLDVNWIKEDKSTKDFTFLPQLKTDEDSLEPVVQPITQIHRIVFFGLCCYLESNKAFNVLEFKEWMRYVWNMARNSDVQTIDSMQKVMKHLNNVKSSAHNIISYLAQEEPSSDAKTYFERQINEEIIKAKSFNAKKQIFITAEDKFHGNILFLLDDCLLNSSKIEEASKLINNAKGNKWLLPILPYLSSVFINNGNQIVEKKEIVFYDKDSDKVKIINYNNDLVDAVKSYLKGEQYVLSEDSWVYPLEEIPSLIENTKKIQNYYWWPKEKEKHGIYLFKSSNWSEKNCILLYSFYSVTQKLVKERNSFIINKINNNGFHVVLDEKDLDKDKLTDSKNPSYGRAIIIKNGFTTYYCGVDKYWDKSTSSYKYYPDLTM